MKISVACYTVILFLILQGCSNKAEKEAIKVMTVNVRYDNPGDSVNAWPNRIPLFFSCINDENPDIIGMQEVLWNQYEIMDSVLSTLLFSRGWSGRRCKGEAEIRTHCFS